jgi:hypothetical protein
MVIAHAMTTHVVASAIAMPTNIVSVTTASPPRLDHVGIMRGLHIAAIGDAWLLSGAKAISPTIIAAASRKTVLLLAFRYCGGRWREPRARRRLTPSRRSQGKLSPRAELT